MDATWHLGPRDSATLAHAAQYLYFIYYIVHKVQPSVYPKGIQHLKPSLLLNPINSLNFSRVGLSSTRFLYAGHVAQGGA